MEREKTYLIMKGQAPIDLAGYLSRARTIITLGRQTEDTYNVISLDDASMDIFQCQFVRSEEGWKVQNGQWRTECPRGILSRLQHACSMCIGRCVNPQTAHPTYSWRTPEKDTLLNGAALSHEGKILRNGDVIQAGNTEFHVKVSSTI